MTRYPLVLALVFSFSGCGPDQGSPTPADGRDGGTPDDAASTGTDTGGTGVDARVFDPDEWHTFEAGPFEVPAGQERFFCYTETLTEDLYTNEIVLESPSVVHHMLLSKTMSPDPEGFFECDVLFQANWLPIFVAGTGDASLLLPEGAGHILEKGTQLTMQLHLLNPTTQPTKSMVPIRLRRLLMPPKRPVEVVVFGSTDIALPARQRSTVQSSCPSDSDMNVFTVFPHMHYLGRSMVVEMGADESSLTEVFRRDDYDFDNQFLEPVDLAIKRGDLVRVSCNYMNDLDETVTFGESTTNEMCFFIGFATETPRSLAGCIDGGGAAQLIPEECGNDPANDIGLGAHCTAGGGECASGLTCTEDIEEIAGPEVCLKIGCGTQSDCGEGGVCCSIAAAGVAICLPPSCQLSLCEVLE